MSDLRREQHPLLCDSDEEVRSCSAYDKRFRSIGTRGRARNTISGAAAVFVKWPDYWSSSFAYWWFGFGMFAITIFIVYNSVAAFAMLPSVHTKAALPRVLQNNDNILHKTFPGVFMHLLYEDNEKLDIKKFIPLIEELSEQYVNFQYNFLLVLNDTNQVTNFLNHEESNKLALDSLWTENMNQDLTLHNIKVKHTTLTSFMNNSPLKKYWRQIPKQYLDFLIKAIIVWDKGGIAIDPLIMVPNSPQFGSKQKLLNLLEKYTKRINSERSLKIPLVPSKGNKNAERKVRVNNIRDIIDALEKGEIFHYLQQENLTEAENVPYMSIDDRLNNNLLLNKINGNEKQEIKRTKQQQTRDLNERDKMLPSIQIPVSTFSYVKPSSEKSIAKSSPTKIIRRRRNVTSNKLKEPSSSDAWSAKAQNIPMILPVNDLKLNESVIHYNPTNVDTGDDESVKLTIDLKGTIIASQTACHSFLGFVFNDVIHHTEESLTKFIISELSSFCRGIVSMCKGIDIIFN